MREVKQVGNTKVVLGKAALQWPCVFSTLFVTATFLIDQIIVTTLTFSLMKHFEQYGVPLATTTTLWCSIGNNNSMLVFRWQQQHDCDALAIITK